MPCFQNGVPVGSKLQHFHLYGLTTNGSAETISISWVATKHCVMEQMIAHWEAVPSTSEEIVLKKLSGVDSRIDTVFRAVDPSTSGENLTDLACIIGYYWDPGDTVEITYANSDDQAVGVEIFLVEVP